MSLRRAGIAAGLLLSASAALAEPLSRSESAAVQAVDAQMPATLALFEALVNINSGTFNIPGVTATGKVLERELQAMNFTVHWIDEQSVLRAPSLLAERGSTSPGSKTRQGKRILLIGHMDTVFEPSSSFQRFSRDGDRVSGPGVEDMKGGLVIMLSALRALQSAKLLDGAAVSVFVTGDEEAAGSPIASSRRDLIAAAKRADAVLSFEAEVIDDGVEYASIARRGSAQWELKVHGSAAHSGGIFSKDTGDGAAFEMARILARFHDELREPQMTYSVGLALAGADLKVAANGEASASGKANIIPPDALVIGDLRVLTSEQLRRVEQKMQAIVAANLPGTSATLNFDDGYPPMAPTPGNTALLARLNEVNAALGYSTMQALDPMKRGAGDASFVAPYTHVLDGLGLYGDGAHTEHESADLARLAPQIKRMAVLIHRLSSR